MLQEVKTSKLRKNKPKYIQSWQKDPLANKIWNEKLLNSKQEMLDTWIKSTNPIKNNFNSAQNRITTKEELDKCEAIPIEHYTVNESFEKELNTNKELSIEKYLVLNTKRASIYVANNMTIYYRAELNLVNDKWSYFLWRPIEASVADSISALLYKKDTKLFIVERGLMSRLLAFRKNKKLYCFIEHGKSMPLFEKWTEK
jgi:hypothetical protein